MPSSARLTAGEPTPSTHVDYAASSCQIPLRVTGPAPARHPADGVIMCRWPVGLRDCGESCCSCPSRREATKIGRSFAV